MEVTDLVFAPTPPGHGDTRRMQASLHEVGFRVPGITDTERSNPAFDLTCLTKYGIRNGQRFKYMFDLDKKGRTVGTRWDPGTLHVRLGAQGCNIFMQYDTEWTVLEVNPQEFLHMVQNDPRLLLDTDPQFHSV